MKILALETSDATGSIAACECDRVLYQHELVGPRRLAQTLAPGLQEVLRRARWQPREIGVVAIAAGPGSFTGLRAGVSAAKVLAYACDAVVIAVNTLEVIAKQATPSAREVWAVLDAQRNQLFAALFDTTGDGLPSCKKATAIYDRQAWIDALRVPQVVTGNGLGKLVDSLDQQVSVSPPETWKPQAASVAELAWLRYQQGQADDLWTLSPAYFRKSAAEEKLAARSLDRAAARQTESPS